MLEELEELSGKNRGLIPNLGGGERERERERDEGGEGDKVK